MTDAHRYEKSGDATREETAALLRRARGGSPADLDDLARRCAAKLVPLVRLRLGRSLRARVESADIVQACLVKALDHVDDFSQQHAGSLMAWLARIAENEIRDQADFHGAQRRDAGSELPLTGDHLEVAARVRSALSEVIRGEQSERLTRAIESLEPDHREVVTLRKLEELSFAEVASRMGRSEDACRMLLARAMTALTLALERTP